jgi:hypothetical protein
VPRTLFGPKRDDVMRGWRNLHNKEFHDSYSSASIITKIKSRIRKARNVVRIGEKRNVYRSLVGKPRRRWMDNIKMDLLAIGLGGMVLIGLAQDGENWRASVNAVMNLRVPTNARKLSRGHVTVRFRVVLSPIELVRCVQFGIDVNCRND